MTEIKLYKKAARELKTMSMCFPFVVIGSWDIFNGSIGANNYFLDWFCTLFFGFGIAIGLLQTFDRRPQIIISEKGIWDRSTNLDEIKWEQIVDAFPNKFCNKKVISIVCDDTLQYRKKNTYSQKYKKNSEKILNLHLEELNIDEKELTRFISQLINETSKERKRMIKSFEVKKTNCFFFDFKKAIIYIIISLTIFILTLSNYILFWVAMCFMVISVTIVRLELGNMFIRKCAGIGTVLGLINILLLCGSIEIYVKTAEEVGNKLTILLEEYCENNSTLPSEIKPFIDELNLSIIERLFANNIIYVIYDSNYELKADMLFGIQKKYDKNEGFWI